MQSRFRVSLFHVVLFLISISTVELADAKDPVTEYTELYQKFQEQYAAEKYDEAEVLARRALSIAQTSFQNEPEVIASAFHNVIAACILQRKFDEAERVIATGMKYAEQALGRDTDDFATLQSDFADVRHEQHRYDEAETLCRQATQTLIRVLGPGHLRVATVRVTLARILTSQGRYAEADTLFKQALATVARETPDSHLLAETHQNRAIFYFNQARFDDSLQDALRSTAIFERIYGSESTQLLDSLNSVGAAYLGLLRISDAEKTYQRALKLADKSFGQNDRMCGVIASTLGNIYQRQQRYAEAAEQIDRALAIFELLSGPNSPEVSVTLHNRACLFFDQKEYDKALADIDRSLTIKKNAGFIPNKYSGEIFVRAQIEWKKGQKEKALEDLEQCLAIADEFRSTVAGAEGERATSFAYYGQPFEMLFEWQREMGDLAGAFKTMERSRARSLLEEMNRSHVDLNAGLTPERRASLRERESQIRKKIEGFEHQLNSMASSTQTSRVDTEKARQALEQARADLYEHYRDERSANPIYRDMITRQTLQPTLEEICQKLLGPNCLALIYLFNSQGGYVLTLGEDKPKLDLLSIDETAAKILGTTAGPLTQVRLSEILVGNQNVGVIPQLARRPERVDQPPDPKLISQLEVLYSVLIPETQRSSLTSGRFKRLVIVPEGPLALFPFETLVVEGGNNPEYFLDRGPAIAYGPSASVLCNLADRSLARAGKRPPVLTVADPIYSNENSRLVAARSSTEASQTSSGARYSTVGGSLNRLPFTSVESAALIDAFRKAGTELGQLKRELATEANVRFNVTDRKILHLACHGITDQAFGNFFGALALTPGPQGSSDPADDGFLTLPEIYELKLHGCELAILSACETNYGPQQKGEGTWALSRGFLIAGARRVIASNWLVDDEAAANLIGGFCADLAMQLNQQESVSYAEKLQAAKKSIRDQGRWRSPYFWSPFVLVGPN